MAELKTLATPSTNSVKEAFVGSKTKTSGKRPQARPLSDNSSRFIKIGLYGDYGTGKTFALIALLLAGLKILVVSTDIGGDGLSTVIAELKALGRLDLLKNIFNVTMETYEQMVDFEEKPELFFPEIYEWDPDVIAWDGFSGFQQNQVTEYVDNDESVYDREGKQITLKYWGQVKQATRKNLNRFLSMHNKKTGKLWHKFVTMLVDDKAADEALAAATDEKERLKLRKDVKAPLIAGAAAKLIGPAFDFFALTGTRRVDGPDGTKVTQFVYKVVPNDKLKAKVRGVKFDPIIPGDMTEVWRRLTDAYMVKPGQQSEDVKEDAA